MGFEFNYAPRSVGMVLERVIEQGFRVKDPILPSLVDQRHQVLQLCLLLRLRFQVVDIWQKGLKSLFLSCYYI